ncbi:carboxylesterase/lipase family protein [Pseudonocardia nigra]|uniref:carboxylesterase/lipase family protein n=1 Tax=Pseudonocardia nigra TaxID=1921578 RepID=UPI001C5FE8AC|nr:carboxylesterase family protein [Pseudonocardia nigra]
MRRRLELPAAALVGAVLVASCSTPEEPPAAPPLAERVTVEQGELRGVADGDVLRYQAIPYAAPPVGDLRWQAPQPPQGWSGTRDATEPGDRCAQLAAPPDAPHATAGSVSEDCLTLNITAPAGTTPSSRLPVLVWIHGGGFSAGAGSDVDPRRLAEAGPLVVVTINYRLGIFGFLGLPGLPDSGTFGLMDQQAALAWVQHNIAAFGGDPGSVTIAGESAGADGVCAQLASPTAVGLFHRAIMQSGGCNAANIIDVIRPGTGPGGDTWKPLPLVQAAGRTAAAAFGCTDPATELACMRAVPAERLVSGAGVYWSPATGTPTLPRRPSDLIVDRDLRPVPVLAGTTRDEGTLFTAAFYDRAGTPLTDSGFRALLAAVAPAQTEAAGRAYRLIDRSPGRAWADVITDHGYACPALPTYAGLSERAPVYAYEFADPTAPSPFVALPPDLADGVTHGAEMPYLFDLVPGQPELTPDQQALAAEMVARWARFAATGDPNSGDANAPVEITWPRWTGAGTILTITGPGMGTLPRPAADFAADHHCAIWG